MKGYLSEKYVLLTRDTLQLLKSIATIKEIESMLKSPDYRLALDIISRVVELGSVSEVDIYKLHLEISTVRLWRSARYFCIDPSVMPIENIPVLDVYSVLNSVKEDSFVVEFGSKSLVNATSMLLSRACQRFEIGGKVCSTWLLHIVQSDLKTEHTTEFLLVPSKYPRLFLLENSQCGSCTSCSKLSCKMYEGENIFNRELTLVHKRTLENKCVIGSVCKSMSKHSLGVLDLVVYGIYCISAYNTRNKRIVNRTPSDGVSICIGCNDVEELVSVKEFTSLERLEKKKTKE